MGLSDGSTWTARSGELKREKVLIHVLDSISSTVLDMRGSNPLSRSMNDKEILKHVVQSIQYWVDNSNGTFPADLLAELIEYLKKCKKLK